MIAIAFQKFLDLVRIIALIFFLLMEVFAYSITWISMKQPSIGWLFLGCLIGGTSGFFQALKSIKQDDIFKIINLGRFITIALALLIIISGYVAIVVKTDICYIRKS